MKNVPATPVSRQLLFNVLSTMKRLSLSSSLIDLAPGGAHALSDGDREIVAAFFSVPFAEGADLGSHSIAVVGKLMERQSLLSPEVEEAIASYEATLAKAKEAILGPKKPAKKPVASAKKTPAKKEDKRKSPKFIAHLRRLAKQRHIEAVKRNKKSA